MSQLLFLDDMLSDLLATHVGASGPSQTVPKTGPVTGDSTSHQEQCPTQPPPDHHRSDRQPTTPITDTSTQPLQMNRHSRLPPPSLDRDAHANPPSKNIDTLPAPLGRDSGLPARNFDTFASTRPLTSFGDQVLRVNDVAALPPRREFKLHGGQISDVGSDMSYSNLCKQIDEGLQEGFTGSEVIRTVLNIIKPGTFREMLTNKSHLSVDELKRFLRAHIRDKSSAELIQEQDKESPQQFLYRIMG